MSESGAPPGRDAAWVVLATPLPASELAAFCRQLETLYRINPFLEFDAWELRGANEFRAVLRNHSNGRREELVGRLRGESESAWRIDFAAGLKRSTRFEIEPCAGGSRLTITDVYRSPEPGAAVAESEVDRSLHAWGVALKSYLEQDRRWGWLPLFRFCRRRLWLPMKPAARRITFLVLVIGLADLFLVVVGLAVYWLEAGRSGGG